MAILIPEQILLEAGVGEDTGGVRILAVGEEAEAACMESI